MRYTEEQKKATAEKLGLTAPNVPADVQKYRADLETFYAACREYTPQNLDDWRFTQSAALEKIDRGIADLQSVRAKYVEHSETVVLASAALAELERKFENQIVEEMERPRKIFEASKEKFLAALTKEIRSVKYRSTRLQNTGGWWSGNGITPEALVLMERDAELEFLLDSVRFTYYTEGGITEFTEDAVLEIALARDYGLDALITRLNDHAQKVVAA